MAEVPSKRVATRAVESSRPRQRSMWRRGRALGARTSDSPRGLKSSTNECNGHGCGFRFLPVGLGLYISRLALPLVGGTRHEHAASNATFKIDFERRDPARTQHSSLRHAIFGSHIAPQETVDDFFDLEAARIRQRKQTHIMLLRILAPPTRALLLRFSCLSAASASHQEHGH